MMILATKRLYPPEASPQLLKSGEDRAVLVVEYDERNPYNQFNNGIT